MNVAVKPSRARALHVLIADDDKDTISTLSAILVSEGHTVSAVYSGVQVMPAIERYRPDVCIIDIEMPGQSGYATAQEIIEKVPETQRPRLIAISGRWTAGSDKLLAEVVGFEKFFLKPADPAQLAELLDDIARRANDRPD